MVELVACGKPQAPRDGAAAMAVSTRQLHQPRALRLPVAAAALVRPHFPFARLAVAAQGVLLPQLVGELLVVNTSFASKNGRGT